MIARTLRCFAARTVLLLAIAVTISMATSARAGIGGTEVISTDATLLLLDGAFVYVEEGNRPVPRTTNLELENGATVTFEVSKQAGALESVIWIGDITGDGSVAMDGGGGMLLAAGPRREQGAE